MPIGSFAREDCSAASEVVGTLTGSEAWQGFFNLDCIQTCIKHFVGKKMHKKKIQKLLLCCCNSMHFRLTFKFLFAIKGVCVWRGVGNMLQPSGRIQVQHTVRVAAWVRPLITRSGTSYCVKATAALYLVSILISLSLVWWGNVHRGQPRDKEGETEGWRERTLVREEKIRGKINVTRTGELY